MFIATLNRLKLGCVDLLDFSAVNNLDEHYRRCVYSCLWRILNKDIQYDPGKPRQVPVHFHNTRVCYSSPQPPFSSSSSSSSCLSSFSAGMLPGKIQGRWRASLFDWLAGDGWVWPNGPYISIVARETAEAGSWAKETSRWVKKPTDSWYWNNNHSKTVSNTDNGSKRRLSQITCKYYGTIASFFIAGSVANLNS